MPTERCSNCNQVKRGVELCSSDDRLCPECCRANEQQLKELQAAAADTVNAFKPVDDSVRAISGAAHKPDAGLSTAESKKTKSKLGRERKNKPEEVPGAAEISYRQE